MANLQGNIVVNIPEEDLGQKSTLGMTDYVRIVGSDGISYKQGLDDVSAKIITEHNDTQLGGVAQSVKQAIDTLDNSVGSLQSDNVQTQIRIDSLQAAVGTPLVASTVAGMTDHDKIYVYVGSESGYTNGHWYYWNGSAWTDGGVYNSTAFETDKTLTLPDRAADAKATGDAIDDVKSALVPLYGDVDFSIVPDSYWRVSGNNAGKPMHYEGWSRSLRMPCTPGETLYITTTVASSYNVFFNTDTDGDVNSTLSLSTGTNAIKVPNGAYYLGISMTSEAMPLTKILQILDATTVYEKLGNLENEQVTNDKVDDDAFLYRNVVPNQYIEMPAEPTSYDDYEYLERKINSLPEGKQFFFVTDTHWGDAVYDSNNQNAKGSNKIIQYIRRRTGIKTVVFGGDVINTYARSGIAGAKQLREYIGEAVSMFGADFLTVFGNHDNGIAGASSTQAETRFVPWDVSVPIFTKHLIGCVTEDRTDIYETIQNITSAEIETLRLHDLLHYYYDDEIKQIRYIILNTEGPEYDVLNKYFGSVGVSMLVWQLDFLYSSLISTPAGFDVVIASHYGKHSMDVSNLIKPVSYVARMVSAFKRKTTVSIDSTEDDRNSNFEKLWSNTVHEFDFSGAPTVGKAIMISGHMHQDYLMVWKKNSQYGTSATKALTWDGITPINPDNGDVLVISLTTDNYQRDDAQQYTRVFGETTDQAFDVVTLNDTGVTLTRVGAGNDRVIPFVN